MITARWNPDVNLTLLNVQSYRYKEMVLIDYLLEHNKEIFVVTETWLRNSDSDKIWIDASELSESGHKTYASNRLERWGGGIALTYNMNMRTIKIMEGKGCSKVVDLGLIALYHPQYTCASHITKTVCLDEFTVFAAVILLKYNNIILLGDINLHINDQDDPDVCMFLDIINVMGLMQHVNSLTQGGRNTLDAIMTESHSEIKIVITIQGPFISDYWIIQSRIKIEIQKRDTNYYFSWNKRCQQWCLCKGHGIRHHNRRWHKPTRSIPWSEDQKAMDIHTVLMTKCIVDYTR